jgi:hypothetical protein
MIDECTVMAMVMDLTVYPLYPAFRFDDLAKSLNVYRLIFVSFLKLVGSSYLAIFVKQYPIVFLLAFCPEPFANVTDFRVFPGHQFCQFTPTLWAWPLIPGLF